MKKLMVIILALLCCSCSLQITIDRIPSQEKPKNTEKEEPKDEIYVGGDRFYMLSPQKINKS